MESKELFEFHLSRRVSALVQSLLYPFSPIQHVPVPFRAADHFPQIQLDFILESDKLEVENLSWFRTTQSITEYLEARPDPRWCFSIAIEQEVQSLEEVFMMARGALSKLVTHGQGPIRRRRENQDRDATREELGGDVPRAVCLIDHIPKPLHFIQDEQVRLEAAECHALHYLAQLADKSVSRRPTLRVVGFEARDRLLECHPRRLRAKASRSPSCA